MSDDELPSTKDFRLEVLAEERGQTITGGDGSEIEGVDTLLDGGPLGLEMLTQLIEILVPSLEELLLVSRVDAVSLAELSTERWLSGGDVDVPIVPLRQSGAQFTREHLKTDALEDAEPTQVRITCLDALAQLVGALQVTT